MTVSRRQLEWRIAVCESEVDATAKFVALVLDTFMDKRGFAWPSRESIAARSGLHSRTAERATDRLEEAGFLIVLHSSGRYSNRYQATRPNPGTSAGVPATPTPALAPPQPRRSVPPTPALAPPEAVKKPSKKPKGIRAKRNELAPVEDSRALEGESGASTQAVVAYFVDYVRERGAEPADGDIGHVARVVKKLSTQFPRAPIEAAIRLMVDRNLNPATLGSLMREAQLGPASPRRTEHIADRLARRVLENRDAQP